MYIIIGALVFLYILFTLLRLSIKFFLVLFIIIAGFAAYHKIPPFEKIKGINHYFNAAAILDEKKIDKSSK